MGIYINDDFAKFYFNAPIEDMNEAGLKRQIDFYTKAGGVEGIIFNLNASRAYFDSKVFEPIWKCVEFDDAAGKVYHLGKEISRSSAKACLNLREMYRNVADPTRIRKAYCAEKGVKFFLSLRINDLHTPYSGKNYTPDNVTLSDYWRDHENFRRASYRRSYRGEWAQEGLDFAEKEVRDHMIALAKEYLAYQPDGFEIDFMRHLPLFKPGYDELHKGLVDEFIRTIRTIAGPQIQLAVRVPSTPDDALNCGLDVAYWAKQGWIDIVEPSPSFCSNESDLPLESWRYMLPDHVILSPYIELHNRSSAPEVPMLKTEGAIDRAYAAVFYQRGADTVSLYNHFPYGPDAFEDGSVMQDLYHDLADPAICETKERRHLVTYRDNTYMEGRFYSSYLPYAVGYNDIDTVRLAVGNGTAGRRARLIIGYTDTDNAKLPEVRLNTVVITPDHTDLDFPRLPECDLLKPLSYPIPAGLLHDGINIAELYNHTVPDSIRIMWMEVQIF